ncbi:MAG: hypothetical protein LBH44_08905 [Treponema sp.]|jgi:hypothetical protein|nr:hypothetical protein [Treponema sp.]
MKVLILIVLFAFTACGEEYDKTCAEAGCTNCAGKCVHKNCKCEENGNNNWGYSDNGTKHYLSTNCEGHCRGNFMSSKNAMRRASHETYGLGSGHIIHVEEAFDRGVWASWYDRGNGLGGYYHDYPTSFTYTGEGGTKHYTININGSPKSPCFCIDDLVCGSDAAHTQIDECQSGH